jgi:mycofactocin precursor
MSETLVVEQAPVAEDSVELVELVEEDLLVEDVSIDGMCGVY